MQYLLKANFSKIKVRICVPNEQLINLVMLEWGYSTYTSSKFTVDVFLAKRFLPFSHAINTSDTGIYTSILFQLYVINTSNTGKYTSRLIYINICLQLIRFCTVCIGFKLFTLFQLLSPYLLPFFSRCSQQNIDTFAHVVKLLLQNILADSTLASQGLHPKTRMKVQSPPLIVVLCVIISAVYKTMLLFVL